MSLPPHKHPYTPWIIAIAVIGSFLFAVYYLSEILTPFIIAAVLAYILNPLVCKIEKLGINRSRASMWVMLFTFLLIVALLLVIIPMLVEQFNLIIERIPKLVDYVQTKILPWFNQKFDKHIVLNEKTITTWLRANASVIQGNLQKTLPAVMQSGGALASGLSNLILLPLLLYYFLLDWSHWEDGVRTMIPRRYLDGYNRIAGNMDTVLGEFLRGQLMVMLIMGMLYGTGLMLTGLDSGFAIGMVAGILVFVPYLGAFTGLLLATLAAVLQFNTWGGLLAVWGVFAVGQLLESFLITPKIVGDRIGLSPFWVIFSLMAFGQLFGFVGMLIALPLAAICLVLIQEGKAFYLNSRFYQREE